MRWKRFRGSSPSIDEVGRFVLPGTVLAGMVYGGESMVDEKALRLPTFVEGTRIGLANGQAWSLPDPPSYGEDDEHQALLRVIVEAEDEPERLRAELALTIFLLSRNYHLTSTDYTELLDYAPGDPALGEMQAAVGELATGQSRTLRPLAAANSAVLHSPPAFWRLTHLLGRAKHV